MKLAKRIGYYRRHGLLIDRLLHQFRRLGIRIFIYYLIREGEDYSALPALKGNIEEYSFDFLPPAEIKEWSEKSDKDQKEAFFVERMNKGNTCYCAKHQGRIVAYTWIDFEECRLIEHIFRLKEGEAYLYDMYTMPAFRGRNIAPHLRQRCHAALKKMGIHTFYSLSERFNTPAVNLKKKLNGKFLRLYLYVDLWKKYKRNFLLRKY